MKKCRLFESLEVVVGLAKAYKAGVECNEGYREGGVCGGGL